MSIPWKNACTKLLGLISTLAISFSAPAFASDSLPGDAVAPPVNVNIGLFYDEFSDAGEVGALRGSSYGHDTHISADIAVARYIRTFDVAGFLSGIQAYAPYLAYLGGQKAGIRNIAGPYVPALGGQLPSYGAGSANLSAQSGFGQPNFGIFSFLLNNPNTGTYGVVAPWIGVPVSSFNKNANLNPGENTWTYELELGFRTVLLGHPNGKNLAVEIWSESYFFSPNHDSAYVSPAVSANAIPPIYGLYNALSGGAIPDSNPLQPASAVPASFHEQPSQEFRLYLPYEFYPTTRAFIAPGLFQSFGGKQTYTLGNGEKLDSGNRTEETQLRLIAASFVSPTVQLMLMGEYDVEAHGTLLSRNIELRLAKFF